MSLTGFLEIEEVPGEGKVGPTPGSPFAGAHAVDADLPGGPVLTALLLPAVQQAKEKGDEMPETFVFVQSAGESPVADSDPVPPREHILLAHQEPVSPEPCDPFLSEFGVATFDSDPIDAFLF